MANSWQQPVAGEPSLGTPHPHIDTVINTDPGATTLQTVSLAAYVPVGTKAVALQLALTSTTAGDFAAFKDSTDTLFYATIRAQVANLQTDGWVIVPVDSNRNIYWKVNDVRVFFLFARMELYFV